MGKPCHFGPNRWYCGLPFVIITLSIMDVVIFYSAPELRMQWAIRVPPRQNESLHLLTYMFIHVNATHLYSNLVVQLFAGIALEILHGPFRVVVIYLCAGIIGGAFEAILTTRAPIIILGASGAVYGLIGAYGAHLFYNWRETPFALAAAFIFVAYFVFDVIQAVTTSSSIALTAHYAGALSGLLFTLAVARNLHAEWYEYWVRVSAIIVNIVLFMAVLFVFEARI